MKLRVLLVAAASLWMTSAVLAQNGGAAQMGPSAASVSSLLTLPVTTRGQTVTIYGTFPNAPVKVNLSSSKPGDKDVPVEATRSDDGKSISFKVPLNGPVGDYLVFAEVGTQELPVPGELRIQADEMAKVTLDAIWPPTVYLNPGSDGFDFVMTGQNLAHVATDNTVIRVGYGPLDVGSATECANLSAMKQAKKICLSYDPGQEGKRLNVYNYHPLHFEGSMIFQVQVGNNTSNGARVTLSGVRAETLRLVGVILSLGIAILAFVVGFKAIGNDARRDGISAIFLSSGSRRFDLAKIQAGTWTAVVAFSYLYLFFCRALVQWNFTIPPLPDSFPKLLGVGAGTTAIAAVVGANEESRFRQIQFLIWTIIGCFIYLGCVLFSDPAYIESLPDVPSTLLVLMGVVSINYAAPGILKSLRARVSNADRTQSNTKSEPPGREEAKEGEREHF